jgi:glycosyltransferase involved in cell wall biosynthesis
LNRVDHCIVKSQTAKDLYRQRGFLEATVIPPAVDVHRFKKAESSDFKRKLGLAGFTIGFVGRFVEEKGVRDLLHAANILNFPFQLLFVGRGPARKGWKELAGQLSIGDKIAWIDTVSHGEIERYLNCLDVLVLPSHSTKYWKEQFGRVLIEAMACGVPVIGSDSGEIPNVIGDAGLIFHEGDSDDLCRQLQRIHDDRQLREELVQRGLDRVRKRFSTEAVAEEYLRLFQLITSV